MMTIIPANDRMLVLLTDAGANVNADCCSDVCDMFDAESLEFVTIGIVRLPKGL